MFFCNKIPYQFILSLNIITKMPIRVLVNKFIDYPAIIKFYNSIKPTDEYPLEILDRAEGGFQIKFDREEPSYDPNDHIRQLRWSQGSLVSAGYIGFTVPQERLLYESLLSVLGGNVLFEL